MIRRFIEAWFLLLYFDCLIGMRSFAAIHATGRRQPKHASSLNQIDILCRAIDFSCVFYFKRVLCLQRSAATAVLLRRYGHKAELVIGVQMLPFQSHAWVEVDGSVVNDKPYVVDRFKVLERC